MKITITLAAKQTQYDMFLLHTHTMKKMNSESLNII